MFWAIVFLAVALAAAPFVGLASGGASLAALSVAAVFTLLALGAAAASLIERLR